MGIGCLPDSIATRQRWAESHYLRISIVSNILSQYDLTGKEDITKDLQKYKIKHDNEAIAKLKTMIEDTMNPFGELADADKLYNLGTGKSAQDCTKEFVLNIKENGNKLREKFIKECVDDATRFEKYLKTKTVSHRPINTNFYCNWWHVLSSFIFKLTCYILECDGQVIHFIADKWKDPSIKDCERTARSNEIRMVSCQIKGVSQKRSSNWLAALQNSKFKSSLIAFFVNYWNSNDYAKLINNKILVFNNNVSSYTAKWNCGMCASQWIYRLTKKQTVECFFTFQQYSHHQML